LEGITRLHALVAIVLLLGSVVCAVVILGLLTRLPSWG